METLLEIFSFNVRISTLVSVLLGYRLILLLNGTYLSCLTNSTKHGRSEDAGRFSTPHGS